MSKRLAAIVIVSSWWTWIVSCASDDGGGTGGSSGGPTTSATSGPSSGPTSSGSTGGSPSCSDDYDGNQSVSSALDLGLDMTDTVQGSFGTGTTNDNLIVCDGEPDFFSVSPSCPGFLAVEARRLDDEVLEQESGGEYMVRDPDGTFDLYLYANEAMTPTHSADGSPFYLTPIHTYVTAGTHIIEVRHDSGADQEYELRVTFLPAGNCATAEWACEATTSLTATETACDAAPVSGACPMGSVTTSSVAVPTFTEGMSTVNGWVVHTAESMVRSLYSPNGADVEAIEARCVAACEREWSDNPAVAASCTAAGAFETPRRFATPSEGAVQLIPGGQVDGSGIFAGQSLSCDLHDDCCEAFDEALCAAAPTRVTPASTPIGRGVETVYALDDDASTLTASEGTSTDDVKLYGTIGISECTAGSASSPCPFYLGSLEVKSFGSIVIPITCPWGTVNRTLYNLEIDLVQPAFGIAKGGTDEVGFPPGSLVFDATFKRNAQDVTVRGANLVPVLGTVSGSSVAFDEIPIAGMMPGCTSAAEIPAEGTFDLSMDLSGSPDESPPSLSLGLPSTVTCPSSLNLTASASDPDGDLLLKAAQLSSRGGRSASSPRSTER